jgi:heme/copper-type cytochrome/quinol oxidase subunit 3
LFTLLGFMGLYVALGILFLFLIYLEVVRGPAEPGQTQVEGLVAAR